MRKVSFVLSLVISIAVISQAFAADNARNVDLGRFFAGFGSSTMVLKNLSTGAIFVHNAERAGESFTPCSTFKVMNSLIALETGVADGPDFMLEWNGIKNWMLIEEWNRDHTMRTAMKYSVVWYYQEIARRIGARRMSENLLKAGYGNCDISSGVDGFWLDGSLRISALGQVAFLEKLFERELPFSRRAMETVLDIMKLDEGKRFILRGKTGSGMRDGKHTIGWFVGVIETPRGAYAFAANASECAVEGSGPLGPRVKKCALDVLGAFGLTRY